MQCVSVYKHYQICISLYFASIETNWQFEQVIMKCTAPFDVCTHLRMAMHVRVNGYSVRKKEN